MHLNQIHKNNWNRSDTPPPHLVHKFPLFFFSIQRPHPQRIQGLIFDMFPYMLHPYLDIAPSRPLRVLYLGSKILNKFVGSFLIGQKIFIRKDTQKMIFFFFSMVEPLRPEYIPPPSRPQLFIFLMKEFFVVINGVLEIRPLTTTNDQSPINDQILYLMKF